LKNVIEFRERGGQVKVKTTDPNLSLTETIDPSGATIDEAS
jgi:hypothetical protein